MSSASTTRVDSPQDSSLPLQPHHVVVVGGSYGGLSATVNLLTLAEGKELANGGNPVSGLETRLQQGLEVTLIDERDGLFHTVGAPLAHTTRAFAAPFWKPYASIAALKRPELSIRKGSVTEVDCTARVVKFNDAANGGQLASVPFDFLVLATGLRRAFPSVPRATETAAYVLDALEHVDSIERSKGLPIVVIGGGAVGVEFAGEIAANHPANPVKLIHSRSELLSSEPLPDDFKAHTLRILREQGVDVILGERPRVERSGDTARIIFGSGRESFYAGHVVVATSRATPSTEFLPTEALDAEGYVRVDTHLKISSQTTPNADRIFAIGDIAANQSIKRAGAALHMGRMVAVNVYLQLLGNEEAELKEPPKFTEFPAVPPMMALAVGKQAITYGPGQEVKYGEDQMKWMFQDDLGWKSSLTYLGF